MSGLLYREDMDEVRKRLTTWWNGGDIGRPAMLITAARPKPIIDIPAMPTPAGWVTDYSITNYEYRRNLAARACSGTCWLGEAVPAYAPDLAPNCLALYLGCKGVDAAGSVWCEPFIDNPSDDIRLRFDPNNIYWRFSQRLGSDALKLGKGKYLMTFEDLIEGLDTLAALRGTEQLLVDLIERPEWIHLMLRQITDLYFHYYDMLYDRYRDEVGGSVFWAWAPGRMAKFQCDFSAMISPEMFGEFMVPVLREMTERVSYCMYHWDGPGAIPHHDHLLSIPALKMIQWTPGSGVEPDYHPRWWPLYHKTLDAGKKMIFNAGDAQSLRALKKEFGPKLNNCMLWFWTPTPELGQEALRIAEG